MQRTLKIGIITLLVPIGLALLPSAATAQMRSYPYGSAAERAASHIRLQVTPKQAQVYVDGYYVGTVDDFDGVFDRLIVQPGEHELVLYMQGYRTVRQKLQLRPREDSRIKYKMERLPSGQANEPPPTPAPSAEGERRANPQQPPQRRPRPPAEPRYPQPPEPPQPPQPPQPPEPGMRPEATAPGFGALVFRVQPAGAEILIDGEKWEGPEGEDRRLVVQVPAGRHRIEIRKSGYSPFSSELTIRGGETTPLNVSLAVR